jgi:hypothetical protein
MEVPPSRGYNFASGIFHVDIMFLGCGSVRALESDLLRFGRLFLCLFDRTWDLANWTAVGNAEDPLEEQDNGLLRTEKAVDKIAGDPRSSSG